MKTHHNVLVSICVSVCSCVCVYMFVCMRVFLQSRFLDGANRMSLMSTRNFQPTELEKTPKQMQISCSLVHMSSSRYRYPTHTQTHNVRLS